MEAVFLLVPLAVILIAVAIGAFIWAVNNGQFDDLDNAANRILFDDDDDPRPEDRERDSLD